MKRDIITKIQTTYTPDGSGGYTEETIELGSFDVKLGVSNNVEKATAYGVSVEQILEVISDVPLLEDEAGLYLLVGPSGKDGYVGQDGVSPTIATEEIEGGVRVSVTDAQGTSSFELYNGADGSQGPQGPAGKDGAPGKDGKDGEKGKDGTDGFSPTVDMKWNTEGTVGIKFTVTDARGSQSEILPVGPAGPEGQQGEKGEKGDPGEDGYTPVKGVDYWTSDDQTSIVNAVLAALPSAEGVGF